MIVQKYKIDVKLYLVCLILGSFFQFINTYGLILLTKIVNFMPPYRINPLPWSFYP